MKRMKFAIASTFAVIAAAATVAVAAPKKAEPIKPATPEQLAEAKGLVQKTGVACTVQDARFVGTGKTKTANGNEDTKIYEVSCQEKLGWIVAGLEKSPPNAYNCMTAAVGSERLKKEGKEFGELCKLPANQDFKGAAQNLANRAGLACQLTDTTWIGQLTTGNRYEIACTEGPGYLLDVPNGATDPIETINCMRAANSGSACTLTPKDRQTAFVSSIAAKAGKQCTVSDARFVATDAAKKTDYYEVACSGAAGFMVEADAKGGFIRSVDCTRASGIAGGCTLTDVATAKAGEAQAYADRLKASGVNCAITNQRRIGVETKSQREVMEFACSDKPAGLIAFFPPSGKVDSMDCITAESRALKCELTGRAGVMTAVTNALTAGGKTCPVKAYQVLGASSGDGEVLEVACDNGKGYIVDLPLSRAKPDAVLSCQQSASRGGDKCSLPENAGALQGN